MQGFEQHSVAKRHDISLFSKFLVFFFIILRMQCQPAQLSNSRSRLIKKALLCVTLRSAQIMHCNGFLIICIL